MTEPRDLTLLACQIDVPETPDAAARDSHLRSVVARIRAVAEPGQYDLIVLPELSAIEYSEAAFARLDLLAEPLEGPSFMVFAELAQAVRATVVYGFARRDEAGRHFICQAAVGPDGVLLGFYDKLHLAQFGDSAEAGAFRAGDHLFQFEICGLRIAPLICYDIRFPELTARLAADGVDLVLQCSAYAHDLSFHSWRPFVVTRAMEQGLAWLGLNRAGDGWGGSIWCPGYADAAAPEQVFGPKECFVPLQLPRDFRRGNAERLPFDRDRRGDYAGLPVHRAEVPGGG
ncbi:carbon-nitrogen hydrolase family protein [Marimonas arenosa]|uniref:Carbon-nitrogen hydrolase family protein n=1 Tax=Marimonas arenosa TaxID=1795305 RepID=A0AAE3WF44_9RHOB|nr:carbon-nitrogen hydrolase family protein [Marimonas arenosa]MDQ2091230.1 carbon-nitrogen hydrolase family protein [Marimonas arenosa]